MKRYNIEQFAKEVNVTVQTLRNWDHAGKPTPDYVSLSCKRYSPDSIKELRKG
ncbi:MerR family transcriptional regulator [Sporosarcina sp. ACRSM]|uniref:MerR family transcriptional regulator n=1 Tax=Sporosarcina sp. ACRSM TaxID=2918216 RepID=UPI001EF74171|nr:MerR family transcriptional regulator [Sporosarcina sp. ACRSM]MCG7337146.1 MerR family transcriptional regulator [Sporosarcina sp. ACRSM]